jgi:hypothetical protein
MDVTPPIDGAVRSYVPHFAMTLWRAELLIDRASWLGAKQDHLQSVFERASAGDLRNFQPRPRLKNRRSLILLSNSA